MVASTDSEHNMSYSFDDNCYGDLHKDVYGFRPHRGAYAAWAAMSDDEKQAEWNRLCSRLDEVMAERKEEERHAIEEFEKRVANVIAMGAGDRETALRWIMDASDSDGDWDYLCYHCDLPYGYFKVVPDAAWPAKAVMFDKKVA